MATTITSGNATNGAAVSSDNTGTLQIKTGTGAGTTAISIDASQVVTMPGPVAIPGNLVVTGTITSPSIGGGYVLNSYVAPATWDATTKIAAGLKSVKVTVIGAGGSGGASGTSTPTNTSGGGGGGGGGGSSILYLPAPSISGPVTVTAGPGTNSFGPWNPASPAPTVTTSATAGSAGGAGGASSSGGSGSSGGAGAGGTFNFDGSGGSAANATTGGGSGSSAIFNGMRFVGGAAGVSPGITNTVYGGGASGAGGRPQSPSGTNPGATGAPGIVIIEEFY
jgi:hypothetical protein